ncbi:hypothetical protein AVI51_16745 (plasmid) [Piscirickettsia salmonis]|uniref:Antitoxin HicB n=2 Tax=Piscirickettsia salmonis TaxID=1238 RepID=A0A9Q5VH30_PISSA|nr:type II toxin-antitoxin system HicB family antitoxin [Piscirickettsia salmonis]ALA26538.1 DNA binding protein [Piscirickettsia salmonis]APS45919.1 hypothetical protein AVI48_15920 [Piscirickettsia salmonis]APS49294.1 hypothetical protein AVI49_16675 [Piscirickettsia salmonis]APS52511.1 hypothetical protein AVI50_16810 [Piscirickettsia salmonis]APS55749.1 hypothetical protein AVI51_16745 [Piscirickettsia salmonis]
MELKLSYPAKFEEDNEVGGYVVSFRDLPNIFTDGETIEEAMYNARDVLNLLLTEMIADKHTITEPSDIRKSEILIPVSPQVAAPILLHKLRELREYSLAQVARRLNVPYQNYQQIEKGENLTLKRFERAAEAMGARVEIILRFDDEDSIDLASA